MSGSVTINLQTGQAHGEVCAAPSSPAGLSLDAISGQASALVPAAQACAPSGGCDAECSSGAGIVIQGVPGPVGPVGPEFLPGFTAIAAVTLSALRVVYRAADGLRYASADAPSTAALAAGVLPSVIAVGESGFVQTSDEMTDASWAWSLGSVWLGINGVLTQTPISSGAQVEIGIALTPTTLLIRVQPSILIQ